MSGLDIEIREWQPGVRQIVAGEPRRVGGIDGEFAFVADAWCNTLRGCCRAAQDAEWQGFRTAEGADIDEALESPSTRVVVATPPGDESTLYGFAAIDTTRRRTKILLMAFVKRGWRNQDIGTRLLTEVGVDRRELIRASRLMREAMAARYAVKTVAA